MQHHQSMKRITTSVDPTTYAALEDLARRDGVSTSRLLREAMERYVAERDRTLEPHALPDWVGMLEGDGQPFAERDEALLDEWWAAELEAPPTAELEAPQAEPVGKPAQPGARAAGSGG